MYIKKITLALAMAVAMVGLGATATLADYRAIAAGPGGAAVRDGSTMDSARNIAIQACRNNSYGSCSVSTAERSYWTFGVAWCGRSLDIPYTAASPQGVYRVAQILYAKAKADGYDSCSNHRYWR